MQELFLKRTYQTAIPVARVFSLFVSYQIDDSFHLTRFTPPIPTLYLHHLITSNLHPPTLLPQLLSLARLNLFPNASLPPPSPPPPSAAEIISIKRSCAEKITSLLPPAVCRRLFAGDSGDNGDQRGVGDGDDAERDREREEWIAQIEKDLLDPFGDAYLNKHLAYQILEVLVVRAVPEVGEKRVEELMRERVGDV
ncbi:hypothetical protein ACLMJK_008839 [Lecanora helva]